MRKLHRGPAIIVFYVDARARARGTRKWYYRRRRRRRVVNDTAKRALCFGRGQHRER